MSHNGYPDMSKQMPHHVYPDTDKRHIMFIKTQTNVT